MTPKHEHHGLLKLAGLFVPLMLFVAVAKGEEIVGPVPAKVTRVLDGDTFEVTVRPWLGIEMTPFVRIEGIDTPENAGDCSEEKRLALRAKLKLEELVLNKLVLLGNIKHDKFAGRVVAKVFLPNPDSRSVGLIMVTEGYARQYTGGARLTWCPPKPQPNPKPQPQPQQN